MKFFMSAPLTIFAISSCRRRTMGCRRVRGRQHAEAGAHVERWKPRFGGRRDLGQQRRSLRRGDRERAQLSRLDRRRHAADAGELHLHVTADEIGVRARRGFVRHVHDIDVGGQLEQFRREMREAAGARGCAVDLPRARFRERDERFQVCRRQGRVHDRQIGNDREARDRREVADRVEPRDSGAASG